MEDHADLADAIDYIDPATLDYQSWVEVGMALHESGLSLELWDTWSRRDSARYHEGECAKKWAGFGHGDSAVKSGTIVKMAQDRGWIPVLAGKGEAIPWDGVIQFVDPTWVEPSEIVESADDPVHELITYLSNLFDPEEYVGYAMESMERDGKHIPANAGSYARTAGDIIKDLEKYRDIATALGSYSPDAGAWIRFNPLDGKGVRNSDVTEYRYALVESDVTSREMQLSIMKELQLPCVAIVDSGNKSLHAIVRVEAKDYGEYRDRVDKLYEVCRKNGLDVDGQNKNPSRLSRLPGVERAGHHQSLVSSKCGKASWSEWWEWIQETSDDLPEPENLADIWDDMPELAPPLIDGVLRQGHKMLLAGPSKAGKSFALIELCVAIAEGTDWLGTFPCAQGRVLYVNLELDPASAMHRFRDVYTRLGIEPKHADNIEVWHLRGRSVPMDKLTPSLIRRALKTRPIAVVIDPIYKVITGDENSADQMAAFCNNFDKISQQVGCATIYCHHHSKGVQGQKRSMDRASGSGVFARDPDALLDMVQLDMTDDCRSAHESRQCWEAIEPPLTRLMPDWKDTVLADVEGAPEKVMDWVKSNRPQILGELDEAYQSVRVKSGSWSAWRIEGTLREFASFEPVNVWFDYPCHEPDITGSLADLKVEGELPSPEQRRRKGTENAKARRVSQQRDKIRLMRDAIAACKSEGVEPTRSAVLERIGELDGEEVTAGMLKSWTRDRAKWSPIKVSQDESDCLVDAEDQALPFDGPIMLG